jgi:hypothetical protein
MALPSYLSAIALCGKFSYPYSDFGWGSYNVIANSIGNPDPRLLKSIQFIIIAYPSPTITDFVIPSLY